MHFLDQARSIVRAGRAAGAVSFRREKYVEYGGPTAATAARAATSSSRRWPGLNTLIDFRYTQHFKAQRGRAGGQNRTGAAARTSSSRSRRHPGPRRRPETLLADCTEAASA
jgi:GTP-binding protein